MLDFYMSNVAYLVGQNKIDRTQTTTHYVSLTKTVDSKRGFACRLTTAVYLLLQFYFVATIINGHSGKFKSSNHSLWDKLSPRKQPTFGDATTGEMTSEKRAQKFHADDASLPRFG